jgi:hypothetical protein
MVSTDVRCAFEESTTNSKFHPSDTIRRLEGPTMAVDFIGLLQNYEEAMTEVS